MLCRLFLALITVLLCSNKSLAAPTEDGCFQDHYEALATKLEKFREHTIDPFQLLGLQKSEIKALVNQHPQVEYKERTDSSPQSLSLGNHRFVEFEFDESGKVIKVRPNWAPQCGFASRGTPDWALLGPWSSSKEQSILCSILEDSRSIETLLPITAGNDEAGRQFARGRILTIRLHRAHLLHEMNEDQLALFDLFAAETLTEAQGNK